MRGWRCCAIIFDIMNAGLPLLLPCLYIAYMGYVPHLYLLLWQMLSRHIGTCKPSQGWLCKSTNTPLWEYNNSDFINSLPSPFGPLWTTKLCFLVYLFSTTPLPVGWFKVSESALKKAVSQETRRHEVSADGVRRVRSCLHWSLWAEMHVCWLCGSRQRHAGDNFTPCRLDITVYLTASYAVRTLK